MTPRILMLQSGTICMDEKEYDPKQPPSFCRHIRLRDVVPFDTALEIISLYQPLVVEFCKFSSVFFGCFSPLKIESVVQVIVHLGKYIETNFLMMCFPNATFSFNNCKESWDPLQNKTQDDKDFMAFSSFAGSLPSYPITFNDYIRLSHATLKTLDITFSFPESDLNHFFEVLSTLIRLETVILRFLKGKLLKSCKFSLCRWVQKSTLQELQIEVNARGLPDMSSLITSLSKNKKQTLTRLSLAGAVISRKSLIKLINRRGYIRDLSCALKENESKEDHQKLGQLWPKCHGYIRMNVTGCSPLSNPLILHTDFSDNRLLICHEWLEKREPWEANARNATAFWVAVCLVLASTRANGEIRGFSIYALFPTIIHFLGNGVSFFWIDSVKDEQIKATNTYLLARRELLTRMTLSKYGKSITLQRDNKEQEEENNTSSKRKRKTIE